MPLLLCGSGLGAFGLPEVCNKILSLVRKTYSDGIIRVAYLGTATYDLEDPMHQQTDLLRKAGCEVQCVNIAFNDTFDASILNQAHVILGSGGNTLAAMDRFRKTGVDVLLKEAYQRGAVLTGGSAGAIIYFDGGHSDSADPTSFKSCMIDNIQPADDKSWEYIRVSGLGILPGMLSPHLDQIQSNGVLRGDDFKKMILAHSGERGIGLDHWAGLCVEGDSYEVLSWSGKPGSVLADGTMSRDGSGKPGIWIYDVINGEMNMRAAPVTGLLKDLVRKATSIEIDPREALIRSVNIL